MTNYMNQKFYQKNMAWFYILILSLATVASLSMPIPPKEKAAAENMQVIPQEAIRLRIMANSDSDRDQEVKRAVRDAVNQEVTAWVEHLTSIEEARLLIQSRLPELEKIAKQELEKRSLDYSAEVAFGNIQFPTKLYGQYLYPAGTYEAILITLGEGKGANWWCVLFPPLCFLDFSTGAAVDPNRDEYVDKPKRDDENGQNEAFMTEQEEGQNEAFMAEQEKKKNAAFIVEQEEETEVKFFLKELFELFKSLG